MTGLWLLCLVGAAAGNVLPSDRTNEPCDPGAVWVAEDGCNTCFCLENGVAGCTYMGCSGRNAGGVEASSRAGGEGGLVPLPLPKPDEVAKSFSAYGDALKPLPLPQPVDDGAKSSGRNSEEPEPKLMEERSGVNCTEGAEWQEDCNTCFCLGNGMAACTKVECFTEGRSLAMDIQGYCQANTTWSDACNVCHCIDDVQVVCSYRTCAGAAEAHRHRRQAACTPGTTRQVDCNRCLCLSDGREACTKRFCRTESSQQTFSNSGRAASTDNSDEKCPQQCPADCGSFRMENGCLRCQCDTGPFFGVRPVLPVPDDSEGPGSPGWNPFNEDPVDPGFEAHPGMALSGK